MLLHTTCAMDGSKKKVRKVPESTTTAKEYIATSPSIKLQWSEEFAPELFVMSTRQHGVDVVRNFAGNDAFSHE